MKTHFIDENRKLSIIQLITSFGNWLSFFAIISAIYQKTGSALTAGYLMGIQSLGQAASGLIIPIILNKYSLRRILITTQVLAIPLIALILVLLNSHSTLKSKELSFIFAIYLMVSVLDNLFQTSIENISKHLSDKDQNHRGKQKQIITSFLGSQLLGPLASFFILRIFQFQTSLIIDIITFIVAIFTGTYLKINFKIHSDVSIKELYISKFLKIIRNIENLKLLLSRSLLFYIPVGIQNIYIFEIVSRDLNLDIEYSCFVYSLTGLFALVGVRAISYVDKSEKYSEHILSALNVVLMGISIIPYILYQSLFTALLALSMNAIFIGGHKFSSQTLRRKMIPINIFPNFLSIELFIAMTTEWLIAKFGVIAGTRHGINSQMALTFALPFYLILALTYLSMKTPKNAVNA